ncbi:MAG TPA: hypothetical protein PKE13_10750 [Hyphomicrobium zavarzinii]|jgi:hypothetical protein|uniref:hypothetical protein n=2 Tax=Hyphomicrobium TaxID=81 RepID=UPI00036EAAC4|nr:hypothetical protein [Hyphomicrobium sp. DMF-1]WBT39689.1 hypothetical protein PE058_07360 [Hyphomicrobium sp. DMF-1]HML43386.1 hypothetical protein [Hyphomicrobium zavarzinii]
MRLPSFERLEWAMQFLSSDRFDSATKDLLRDVHESVVKQLDVQFPHMSNRDGVLNALCEAITSLAAAGQRNRDALERYGLHQASLNAIGSTP